MKKSFILLGLLLIILFASAFSLKEWRETVYEQIKTETIKELKKTFKTDLSIGKTEGIVVGQIIFRDVSVPGFAHAKKVYVNFNPITLAYKKDVVPAISKITIEEAEFEIKRGKDARLNLVDFLPPEEPNAPPASPFRAKLELKNCKIKYQDQIGFQEAPQAFYEELHEIEGEISFQRKDRIYIALSGKIYTKLFHTRIKASGSINSKTGKYDINITADKVDLRKLGNYLVPVEPLRFRGGEADLVLKIASPKTKGWPISLVGNFSFYNASAEFSEYKLEETFGKLFIADENLTFKDFLVKINGLSLEINGRFFNFAKQNLDLNVALRETNLKNLALLFPQTKDLEIEGRGTASVAVQGTASSPRITGKISIEKGKFYNQELAGQADISFSQMLLKLDKVDLSLYEGKATASGTVNFSRDIPELDIRTNLRKIDLIPLSQNSPGITGSMDGELNLSGPITNLKGVLSANLTKAIFFGQAMDAISTTFHTEDGDIFLEKFSATSRTASFYSSGKISRDLNLDFQARAQGIDLSGEGFLGRMETTLEFFTGEVSARLDEDFFASPLKNLKASGEIRLRQGKVGDQFFDTAQGKFTMGEGLINIQNVTFARKQSVLQASGQTGIGYPTRLNLAGEKLNLEDLKILNYLLPEEMKNPTGFVDINIEITGKLSEETRIVSLDPLLDLNAKGKISLINVQADELPLSQGELNILWQERRLSFSQSTFKTPHSNLTFDLSYTNEKQIKTKISGVTDFSEFRKFTAKYGRLDGKVGITLILEGEIENPEISTSFWILGFRFNNLYFDKIEGSMSFSQDKLIFPKPVLFSRKNDQYEISGEINLEPLRRNQPEESYLDLNLEIIKADFSSIIDLSDKLQAEIKRRVSVPTEGGKSKINLSSLILPTVRKFVRRENAILYAKDGEKEYFLKSWGSILQEFKKEIAAAPEENLGGEISGKFSVKGQAKNLSGKFTGQVKNGYYKNFNFDLLAFSASLKDQKIKIDKLELFKRPGGLLARGEIDFEGNLSLDLIANKMPLDSLKILFDQEFKGNFNMNALLEGTIQNPRVSASLAGNNITLAGVQFDNASITITKKNASIFIHECNLLKGNSSSKMSGSITPDAPGRIDLQAELKDNAIGLLNLFTKDIRWIKGKGEASLKIAGTFEDPDISGEISLKENVIFVKAIDSEIKEIEGEAKIEKNLLQITRLTGNWENERTRGYSNFLGLAGTIDLSNIFSKNMVYLSLSVTPYPLFVNLPELFTGVIDLKNAHLYGPLYFEYESGLPTDRHPTLRGKADINNAIITLSKEQNDRKKVFPLTYDLNFSLGKNVYAVMGDITTFDLSNILMNLEIRSDELMVSGTSLYPSLHGKILIKRGVVNIFNREFTLLSTEQQEKYFPYEADKIKENIAVFTGEKGEQGIQPDVTITAKVDVEHIEEDPSGELVKKKVVILSRLQGVVGAVEKERGLNISLYSFVEDENKTLQPAGYGEQEIRVMLLPDFIKSLTGISEGEEVDANLVLADYINSRFQTFIFRGIERELEQKFGLESLTLEYNFGKDIRQAMGVTERRLLEGEKPDWRVGFVKGFFDKLYVDVNYAQFGTETEMAQGSFNYQLTYKLSPIWSIIYYREPISLQEPISGYEKYTLKLGFAFW